MTVSSVTKSSYLERDEQCDCLDRVVPAVHVVAHEQVVGVRGPAPDAEQLHQVVELAVHIAAYRHWTFYLLHVRLLSQNLLSLETNGKITLNYSWFEKWSER